MMKPNSWLKYLSLPAALIVGTLPFQSVYAAEPSHLEHPHSAGTFMIEALAMRMNMDGLRAGTTDVSTADATAMMGDYKHMMVPEDMTMDMFMLMPMYNFTKDLSAMAMFNYLNNSMSMTNGAGTCNSDMETSGLGDTQLSLSYKFFDDLFAASMELSIPTGSIDEKSDMRMIMGGECMEHNMFAPYPMQLGSGTYDITPSLTYLGAYYSMRYGAQLSYKYRTEGDDYTLGDVAKTKLWIRKPVSMVTLSAELDVTKWGAIDGADPRVAIDSMTMAGEGGVPVEMQATPTAFTKNTGGTQADFTIGASIPVSIVALGLDLTMPVYQDLNGLQMKRSWTTALSVSAMF